MIYLDNNATTKASSTVVAAVTHYLENCYANASANTAGYTGADVPRRIAAEQLARLLNAEEPDCFLFTSGATESNNWIFSALYSSGLRKVCISAIEHPSVSEPAERLGKNGCELSVIPVNKEGIVCIETLAELLSPDTQLVSVMAANNETGVVQPIEEIAQLVRARCPTALFHTDATQAIGRIPIDLQGSWAEVDLMSFSAHKFHGPKGIGGMYYRPGTALLPWLVGGGQEAGFRSGTTNTPGLAGLAAAVGQINVALYDEVRNRRDYFESRLRGVLPVQFHSSNAVRLPNTSCFSIPGASGEEIADQLAARGVIVGTGSACSSGSLSPPKTLLAMGVDYALAAGTIRVSLSKTTSIEELDLLVALLVEIVAVQEPFSSQRS
ncbi:MULTISPECIES: cysteine desulfurase family protein [unclassified Janthinobacterium]|uniref:cysteine desulfurase family protein n=1 Tax=unclassified Janthinobacterium TaxID=2610881 RepID=UPI001E3680BB|nr:MULTISPECIES: cysteine desulfurase family protein [unclassified Janthinobacterium]MCC7643312.1 cysteine desulfurase [Janthinobacterium sp. EB271-G4-3-1]MCC7693803.1 cysteine desulfurase [Janthinobacterium sp. EB271-G4-3-2]